MDYAALGASIGVGVVVVGAALGIGRIGAAAAEATARQPDASQDIRLTMIIAAALIEGVALFGVVTCLMVVL